MKIIWGLVVLLGGVFFENSTSAIKYHVTHKNKESCNNPYEEWTPWDTCGCKLDEGCRGNLINGPTAQSPKDGSCYPLYSQADCDNPNEWFVQSETNPLGGECVPNPCIGFSPQESEKLDETTILRLLRRNDSTGEFPLNPMVFFYEGKCVQPFTLGSCGLEEGRSTLFFRGTDIQPTCHNIDDPIDECPPVHKRYLARSEAKSVTNLNRPCQSSGVCLNESVTYNPLDD